MWDGYCSFRGVQENARGCDAERQSCVGFGFTDQMTERSGAQEATEKLLNIFDFPDSVD